MKKIIAVLSLVLVVAMIMATPTFAADHELDYGQERITANKVDKAPVIDGKIDEGEYGKISVTKTDPTHWQSSRTDESYSNVVTDASSVEHLLDRTMQKMDVWFAYDDDNIYIAYSQLGGAWDGDDADDIVGNNFDEFTFRHNYVFRMGFDIENATNLMKISYSMPAIVAGYCPMTETTNNTGLKIEYSNGATYDTMSVLNEAYFSKIGVDGTPVESCNSKVGPYVEVLEMSFSKYALLEATNAAFGTSYESLPTGMFFTFAARQYSWSDAEMKVPAYDGQTEWFSVALTDDQIFDLGRNTKTMPAIVVFGDKVEVPVVETQPAETTPPETDPATVETEPASTPDESEEVPTESAPAETEPATEGGCGGTVSMVGMALVASLGTCAVFVTKKRR